MFVRLRDAATFPFRGPRPEGPLVTGWVLVLANALLPVVPLVPLVGYLLRVIETSARGHDAPPPFLEAFGAMTRAGVAALAVAATYLLVPATLLGVSVYGATTRGLSDPSGALVFVVLAGGTVILAVAATGVYLLPIALEGYATDGLRAAFASDRLRSVGGDPRYFLGWVTGAVVLGSGASLAAAVASTSVGGRLLAALVVAYAALVVARLWGRAVGIPRGVATKRNPDGSE